MKLDLSTVAFAVPLVAAVVLALIGPPGSHTRDVVVPPPPAAAPAPFALKSVSVVLPVSDRTFPGPGAETITADCLACHSASMVLSQPKLPKAAWQGIVEKMMHAYKAPVPPADEASIVDYLGNR